MSGAAVADSVQSVLSEAEAFCASFENGTFSAEDAVSEFDLDGDGTPESIVDESRFVCSSMASAYCGSGGCGLHVVSNEGHWRYQAEGWRIIDWDGRPILLVARDGGWCGGSGAQICFEALVLSHGEMLTVMPPAR